MRDFSQKVYDTNGATPKQNVINQMNARIVTQNKLAQSGGASVEVPQTVIARHQISPYNPNTNNYRMISGQLRMDSLAKAQANTGQKIGGKRKTKRKTKRNRKSRKY
jgi:hypothetical protein